MKNLYNKNNLAFLILLLIIILVFFFGVRLNNGKLEMVLDPKFPPFKIQNAGKTIDNKF